MANLPRILPVSSPQSTTSTRGVGHGRVSSAQADPIEGANQGADIGFESAIAYGFSEEQNAGAGTERRSHQQPNLPKNNPFFNGLFEATSQSFAFLIEESAIQTFMENGIRKKQAASKFTNIISKAINIYETNTAIIEGSLPRKGGALSISL